MSRISKKELKRDELIEATKGAEHWVVEHSSVVLRAAIALVVVLVVGAAAFWFAERSRASGERLFAAAQQRYQEAEGKGPLDRATLEGLLPDFERAARKAGSKTRSLASYYEGLVLHGLGRDEEAEKALAQVASASATQPTLAGSSQALLADICAAKGDAARAVEILNGLVAADPPTYPVDQALLALGKIQLAQGDEAAARASWQRVVDEFSARGAVDEARRLLGS
jgi:tetratricopeptide (TPR) repeat protein